MLSSELRLREGIRCLLVPRLFGLVERFRSKAPLALRATREHTRSFCEDGVLGVIIVSRCHGAPAVQACTHNGGCVVIVVSLGVHAACDGVHTAPIGLGVVDHVVESAAVHAATELARAGISVLVVAALEVVGCGNGAACIDACVVGVLGVFEVEVGAISDKAMAIIFSRDSTHKSTTLV